MYPPVSIISVFLICALRTSVLLIERVVDDLFYYFRALLIYYFGHNYCLACLLLLESVSGRFYSRRYRRLHLALSRSFQPEMTSLTKSRNLSAMGGSLQRNGLLQRRAQ